MPAQPDSPIGRPTPSAGFSPSLLPDPSRLSTRQPELSFIASAPVSGSPPGQTPLPQPFRPPEPPFDESAALPGLPLRFSPDPLWPAAPFSRASPPGPTVNGSTPARESWRPRAARAPRPSTPS